MIGKILEQFFFCKEEPRSDCGNQVEPVLMFNVRVGSKVSVRAPGIECRELEVKRT